MIYTLNVERFRPRGLSDRISSIFSPCRLSARIKKHHHISVLQLRYTAMRGKIRFGMIYPYLKGSSGVVLCDESTDLSGSRLTRFESDDFSAVMMTSFLRAALKDNPNKSGLRCAYYDPMGKRPEIAEQLLEFLPELTVVTEMPKYYEIFADSLMDEKGLSLTVSNDPQLLAERQLIVTSCAIDCELPISSVSLVFSPSKPLVPCRFTLLWDYHVEAPYKFMRLRPDGLDEMYFLSALYSLGNAKELENLIPNRAGTGQDVFTKERVLHRLLPRRRTA